MKVVSSQWSGVSKSVFCLALSTTLFALSVFARGAAAGESATDWIAIFRVGVLRRTAN